MHKHIYDCPDKQKAREAIYGVLGSKAGGKLLILLGPLRCEVDIAVLCGFPLKDIIPIEINPHIVSNCMRRFNEAERKDLRVHIGRLSQTCRALAKTGIRVTAANLDFCKPIEAKGVGLVRDEIEQFLHSGIMEEGLLSVEIYRGRVKGWSGKEESLAQLQGVIKRCFRGTVERVDSGEYRNSISKASTSMLWAIYRLEKNKGESR